MSERSEINRKIVHDAFAGWQAGTADITDLFAAHMVWRIEGRSLLAKEYRDTAEFVEQVLAPFAARFAEGERFRPIRIRAIHADGDTVVVLWDGRGVANDGRPYENSYAWFMTLVEGKVVDGTAFFDAISLNDLWTRVRPGG
jgi:ketosteroid isomerase-like protein